MQDSLGTLFFKDKQVRLLTLLTTPNREWHIADLSKEANVTYVHTSKFVKKCEQYGIITTDKHGRVKTLNLTEKGSYVAKNLATIIDRINAPEPVVQPKPQPAAKQ